MLKVFYDYTIIFIFIMDFWKMPSLGNKNVYYLYIFTLDRFFTIIGSKYKNIAFSSLYFSLYCLINYYLKSIKFM